MSYVDGYWWSNDGLRLHYRDYGGTPDTLPVVCLPGMTRNARDFAVLGDHLAPGRRVLAIDLRGRGESAYAKDPMSYVPLTYVHDVDRLLEELGIARFILIASSLGGVVAMLLAATGHGRVAAIVLNDVGPVLDPSGLDRLRGYVRRNGSWPTWIHAARALAESSGSVYPSYGLNDWLAMAKRLYRLTPMGRIVPDYDNRIAEPFRLPGDAAGVDLWSAFDTLVGTPMLVVRAERSDLLARATADAMLVRNSAAQVVVVPDVGHAPTLSEPTALSAIDALLARAA